jgi:hypothetical protein
MHKGKTFKLNTIIERGYIGRNVNRNLLENKYKDIKLTSIIKGENSNINNLLTNIYFKSSTDLKYNTNINYSYKNVNIVDNNFTNKENIGISNIIFNNIKYKNMGGMRLEVSGRLTKRYRADRAIYKLY